jgi:hypothetical protein
VIGEGANIDIFAEACLLGFGFKDLDFVTNALVGSAACSFWLGREWLVDVWQAGGELPLNACAIDGGFNERLASDRDRAVGAVVRGVRFLAVE